MPPQRSAADSALSRREFLERTALAAGAAGVAGLSADTLLEEAAASAHRWSGLPQPRNVPIDHFVLLMMENRSFDHYFGWLDGHADATQRQRYRNPEGQLVKTRSASTLGTGGVQFKGCGYLDPGHGWNSGRAQLLGGFLAEGSENDEFALTYYDRRDLGFLPEAAKQYTLYDRYFCSVLAGTWPNRYYKWSAQSGGVMNNRVSADGNSWETIFDRATARGLSVRYYYSDLPFGALWGARATPWLAPISRYYEDAAAGKLPNIAIVDPPFKDGRGGDGLSADEHPLGDIRLGQAFQADVAGAFVKSPNYKRGAMFVMYDEWGGFFDHVKPPRVPDDRASADLYQDFGQMGFRVPAIAISPYARNVHPRSRGRFSRGNPKWRVDHGLYGHESILSFISYRFGLGFLTKRHRTANNIGKSFNWWRPDFDRPQLPDPPVVVTQPCALGGGDVLDSQQAHAGDLAKLEVYADRQGLPVYDAKPHEIFTQPDAVQKGIAAAP